MGSSPIHSKRRSRIRSLTQPAKMFKAKPTCCLSRGIPSYIYRNCSNTSWPCSSRESKSVLIPLCRNAAKTASLEARSLCSFFSFALDWRLSCWKRALRLCVLGIWPPSTVKRHFKYSSTANAPFTPYAKPRCAWPNPICARVSSLTCRKASADLNISCSRAAPLAGGTLVLFRFPPVAVFGLALRNFLFRNCHHFFGESAEIFKGRWFSLAHLGNVLGITLNANQKPTSPGCGGRSLSRSISSCHCSWDFRKALSE